ncbi:MAG: hypothetical protein ABSG31_16815 [Tepidisphaeraceae bacterium]|jgi:hypothetical protein
MIETERNEPALGNLIGRSRRQDFRAVIGRMVRMILAPLFTAEAQRVARAMERHARRVLRDMDPRDDLEEMLVGQMILTNARHAVMAYFSVHQKDQKWAKVFHQSADTTANTFRQQMLTLDRYRRPARPSFTAIRQANFAAQQFVTGAMDEHGKKAIQTFPAFEKTPAFEKNASIKKLPAPAQPGKKTRSAMGLAGGKKAGRRKAENGRAAGGGAKAD